MDKVIIEKIYTAVISAGLTFLLGLVLKKAWTAITGNEPPNPEDPNVPTRHAVTWFLASGVGVGVGQLLVSRQVQRRLSVLKRARTTRATD